jgi:predicted Zn-dependent protease
MRLADVIGHWVGRVEIVLAGVESDLRDGEDALSAGDALRARTAAHRVLSRAPDSPIGLALLADACEAAHLDAELALTLEDLARRAPSRAEVWVRLSRARQATLASNDDVRDALLQALAVAEPGSRARADALIALADVDLAAGDGARADLWLERITDADPALALRRAEARLLQRDPAGAKALLASVSWPSTDGRAALAMGAALAELGDPSAFASLSRAMVLDVPGASRALSNALARLPTDGATRARIRAVVAMASRVRPGGWRPGRSQGRSEGGPRRRRHRRSAAAPRCGAGRPGS